MGGGGHHEPAAQAAPAAPQQLQPGQTPCQLEMRQFMECAQSQHDLSLCQAFSDVLRDCKISYGEFNVVHNLKINYTKFI